MCIRDSDCANGYPCEFAYSGVEDVPGCSPEIGLEDQRDTEPEQGQAEDTTHQALEKPVGRDETVHPGTL